MLLIDGRNIKVTLLEENMKQEVLLLSSLENKIFHRQFATVWYFQLDSKPNKGRDFVSFTTMFSAPPKVPEIMQVLDTYLSKLMDEMLNKKVSS